jgi:hypothetical protein
MGDSAATYHRNKTVLPVPEWRWYKSFFALPKMRITLPSDLQTISDSMKKSRFIASGVIATLTAISVMSPVEAGPYYCGGWYGTGIPNGLGWTLFGVGAAGVLAAVAAPFVSRPVYTVPAYGYPAPVYYYQGIPQTEVERRSAPPVSRPNGTLAKAQSKLAALGYYQGSVDGSYGPRTAQAVQQFQADNNLPVSGRLDLKTLSSLGVAP